MWQCPSKLMSNATLLWQSGLAGGYFWRDLRMAQARKPTPAAAPTAGSAVFIVSLFAAEPTVPAADEAAEPTVPAADDAPDATLSTMPGDAGFGGAGARVAVAVEPVRAATAPVTTPLRAGRLIGDVPAPLAGPTTRRSLRRPILSPRKTGSYFVSTTRSFNGMMPLSVMWMPSGQTSVQHLVMLQ